MPSRSRLVTSARVPGQAARIRSANSAASSITCSQLSRTSSHRPVPSRAATASASGWCEPSVTPSAVATARATNPSRTGTRSTNAPPDGNSATASSAITAASRVLPTPPGPSSVTSRASSIAASTAARSAARPTNVVPDAGRPAMRAGSRAPERASSASVHRSVTPYLRSSDDTWLSTVRTEMCSRCAICALAAARPARPAPRPLAQISAPPPRPPFRGGIRGGLRSARMTVSPLRRDAKGTRQRRTA